MSNTKETEQFTKPRTSDLAVSSFVLGLLSIVALPCWPVPAAVAMICGIYSIRKIRGSSGSLKGKYYAISGIITSFAAFFVMPLFFILYQLSEPTEARIATTKAAIMILYEAVNTFKKDTGRYPTNEEGLSILIEKPANVNKWDTNGYLEATQVPKDAWKNDFVYKLNPGDGEPFVIISYGADGKEGGEGYDADLYSTDLK